MVSARLEDPTFLDLELISQNVKNFTNRAIEALVKKSPKIENTSIFA